MFSHRIKIDRRVLPQKQGGCRFLSLVGDGGDRSGGRSLPRSIPICTEVGVVAGKMHSILAAAGQPLPRPISPLTTPLREEQLHAFHVGKYRKPDRKRFPIWFPTHRPALHFTILY